jgi:hypothetical protein
MQLRMRRLLAVASCAILLSLSSCASLQRSSDQGAVKDVADLINAGQTQKLAAMSDTPFLVDQEIVPLKADVRSFWDGVVKAGFWVQGAALEEAVPADASGYTQFANTFEVKSFFSRYVKKGSRVLRMSTSGGTHILLLVRSDWFSRKLIGFKGPF